MAVVIRCPACRTRIRWLVETEPFPDECPQCSFFVGHSDDSDGVVMPFIRHKTTSATDKVYRDIEQASEDRVYQAAEMANCDAADMAGLKITNLRDNMKQGDIAAMPVVNDITRHMDAIKQFNPNAQVGYGADSSAGAEYAVGAATGRIADGVSGSIMPRRGAQITKFYSESHEQRAAEVLQGSYTQKGF